MAPWSSTRAAASRPTARVSRLSRSQAYGRLLLIPGAKAPVAVAARGKQVCSCFDVSEAQIDRAILECTGTPDAQLLQLQDQLQCGTNCGSCVPELKRLVRLGQRVA